MNLFSLRDYQEKAVNDIEQAWASGNKSVCLQLPTGAGKTRILRTIIDNHTQSKKIIYVIAHRKNLVVQLSDELTSIDLKHGIIGASSPYINYRIQVCSLQTLIRRKDNLPDPEILIIDEAHHNVSKSYLSIFEKWPDAKVLGCTATPKRLDGKSLADTTDVLICGPQTKTLIDQGYLSSFDYYAPGEIDMSDVHIKMGEYVQAEASAKVDKKVITGSAIEHYRQYSDHLPALVACVSIQHAIHVEKEFNDSGYKFKAIHSKMEDKDIYRYIKYLADGTIDGLTNCGLIGEGTDIPIVTTLIGLRPTNSETIFLQYCGRVLRKAKGKEKAIILDHVGNYERHGLPDDYREWSLDYQPKKEKGKSKYKRCPECFHPVFISAAACPYCGYLFTDNNTRDIIPKEVEGRLVKIGNSEVREKPGNKKTIHLVAKYATTFEEAQKICTDLGYEKGYAWHVWVKILKNRVA
ncbi:MAG TPA: DEAD/DEAH box helicase [Desulfobacterales bacterium]|nr:DEAD/DEAH box helicase [Desulfobacterales bacterium]